MLYSTILIGTHTTSLIMYVNKPQLTTERVNNSPREQFQSEISCFEYHMAKPQLIRWLR